MKIFNRRYWPLWAAFCTFLLTQLCAHTANITEIVYSYRIYPIIAFLFTSIFRFIPFSVTDLLYVFLLLIIVAALTLWILRRFPFKKAVYIIVTTLAITYTLFYWLWGFNYFRQPLETRIALKPISINKTLFYENLELQIIATNKSYTPTFNLARNQVDSLLYSSYHQIGKRLGLPIHSGYPVSKTMLFSRFYAGNSISGYFGPFTNEVHVNRYLLPVQYPMIVAHEKAHQMGITSEAEASFYGWLACLQSKNPQLVYSANLYILMQFNKQEKSLFDSLDIKTLLKPEVLNDYMTVKEYWNKLRYKKMDEITSRIYDNYLKVNQVKAGIQDYQGVVSLIIQYQNQNLADSAKLSPNEFLALRIFNPHP